MTLAQRTPTRSRTPKLYAMRGVLVVLVLTTAACGSDDANTAASGPLIVGSLHEVDSIPEGASVVTPDQLAVISYFTGINAADEASLRRAMCASVYPDSVIKNWVAFLQSDGTAFGKVSSSRPPSGDTYYPLVDGVEVPVTLTLSTSADGQRCTSDVSVEVNYRRTFAPPAP